MTEVQTCSRCKKIKPPSSYRMCDSCRGKLRGYVRARDKARTQWNVELKRSLANLTCADCGASYPDEPSRLQWDHRPGEVKVGNMANLIAKGKFDVALQEVKKCDLVCASCHAKRGIARGQIYSLPEKLCAHCQLPFQPHRHAQRFCSQQCYGRFMTRLKIHYWKPPKRKQYAPSTIQRAINLGIPLPDGTDPSIVKSGAGLN